MLANRSASASVDGATAASGDVSPSAARLTSSLRDIGYDFPTAVADLVDNSLSAGATQIDLEIVFEPNDSHVVLWDNGKGMSPAELLEAFRFGSKRNYGDDELGRFGLGLKTGSLSQCRRLTVVTRGLANQDKPHVRTLDLDFVNDVDKWLTLEDQASPAVQYAMARLGGHGTAVVWEKLDRVLPERFAETGWGRRRLITMAKKTSEHLGLVFHRFLQGAEGVSPVSMTVNGEPVAAWDPFAPEEPHTLSLPVETFELETGGTVRDVRFAGYILPSRDQFSSPQQFEKLSGPLKWNRQQGLYIYRANRIVQFGGWNGLRGIDEHTKLARASVDFGTGLDETFQVNVAKMRVVLPTTLRKMLRRPVHELCVRADAVYRQASSSGRDAGRSYNDAVVGGVALRELGIAFKAAMLEASDLETFRATMEVVRERHPSLAESLDL